jgi:hypothetical protein
MPMLKNMSRATVLLEHAAEGQVVIKPNETVEVTKEVMSLPLVRHYLEIKKLHLVTQQSLMSDVILTR